MTYLVQKERHGADAAAAAARAAPLAARQPNAAHHVGLIYIRTCCLLFRARSTLHNMLFDDPDVFALRALSHALMCAVRRSYTRQRTPPAAPVAASWADVRAWTWRASARACHCSPRIPSRTSSHALPTL